MVRIYNNSGDRISIYFPEKEAIVLDPGVKGDVECDQGSTYFSIPKVGWNGYIPCGDTLIEVTSSGVRHNGINLPCLGKTSSRSSTPFGWSLFLLLGVLLLGLGYLFSR